MYWDNLTRFLEDELKKFKKKQLCKLLQCINLSPGSNNKKQKQITDFCQKIHQCIYNNKKNGINEEITINQIVERIQNQSLANAMIIKKSLLKYLDWTRTAAFITNPMIPMPTINPIVNSVINPAINPINQINQISQINQLNSMSQINQINQIPNLHNLNVYSMNPNIKKIVYNSMVDNLVTIHKCLCGQSNLENCIQCCICQLYFHKTCLRYQQSQVFQCPFCYIAKMDPMNEVRVPYFMGYLRPESKIHKLQFSLKQSDFANNRLQLEIRCIRFDGKNNYELTWPDYGQLRFNDFKLFDFKPLVYNSSLKKRKDEAKIIERKYFKSTNIVTISEYTAPVREQVRVGAYNHFIGIFQVYKYKAQQLVQQIKNKFTLSTQASEALLKRQFEAIDDIEVQRVDISLRCVYESTKIKIPARSQFCTHFQCVDLENLITVTEKTQPRRWRCPICRKKAHLLCIDPIVLNILNQNIDKRISDVSFTKDGIKLIEQKEESQDTQSQGEKEREPKKDILICLDDEDEPARIVQNLQLQMPNLNSPKIDQQFRFQTNHFDLNIEANKSSPVRISPPEKNTNQIAINLKNHEEVGKNIQSLEKQPQAQIQPQLPIQKNIPINESKLRENSKVIQNKKQQIQNQIFRQQKTEQFRPIINYQPEIITMNPMGYPNYKLNYGYDRYLQDMQKMNHYPINMSPGYYPPGMRMPQNINQMHNLPRFQQINHQAYRNGPQKLKIKNMQQKSSRRPGRPPLNRQKFNTSQNNIKPAKRPQVIVLDEQQEQEYSNISEYQLNQQRELLDLLRDGRLKDEKVPMSEADNLSLLQICKRYLVNSQIS